MPYPHFGSGPKQSATLYSGHHNKVTRSHQCLPLKDHQNSEALQYKLGVVMYSCLHGRAPRYLTEPCMLVSNVSTWQHL